MPITRPSVILPLLLSLPAAAAFAPTFALGAPSFAPRDYTVDWECPRTPIATDDFSKQLVRDAKVTFSLKLKAKAVAKKPMSRKKGKGAPATEEVLVEDFESPEFDQMLTSAEESGKDYVPCFRRTLKLVRESLTQECRDRAVAAGDPDFDWDDEHACKIAADHALERYRGRVSELPMPNKVVPVLFPGERINEGASRSVLERRAAHLAHLKKTIGFGWFLRDATTSCWLSHTDLIPPEYAEVVFSHEFTHDELPEVFSQLETLKRKAERESDEAAQGKIDNCVKQIARFYAQSLSEMQKPAAGPCETLDSPACKILRGRAAEIFEELGDQIPQRYFLAEPNVRFLADDFDRAAGCVVTGADPADFVKTLENQIDAASSCVGPAPGETTVHEGEHGGVKSKYTLMRHSPAEPAHYSAGVNLKFLFDGPDGKGTVEDPARELKMRMKVNECLQRTNEFLTQPNGEKLDLRLVPGPESVQHTVNLSHTERANTGEWSDLTDHEIERDALDYCPTMVHEILHMMGLADEYEERASGFIEGPDGKVTWQDKLTCRPGAVGCKAGFDCRVLGPPSSIMSNQNLAFRRARTKNQPLLYPAQWRLITQPGCEGANAIAYSCMERSQRSSKFANPAGEGCGGRRPAGCTEPKGDDLGWMK
jgi:hypothetical protein